MNGLQQIVRAQIAKIKDVALRAPAGEAPRRATAAAQTGPITPATPVSAVRISLAAIGNPGTDALRGRIAARGELPAIVVAALGGSRYLVDVDGVEQSLVLEGAAITEGKQLLPGAELRLVPDGRGAIPVAQPAPASPTDLSPLGKLIAAASREPGGTPRNPLEPARVPPPLDGRPIAPSPADTAPAHLARSIKDTVDSSGLFYEAHVAEWAEGRRTLESVQREPQARLAATIADSAHAETAGQTLPSTAVTELRSIVREQLQALNAQQVAWQGELWPGQAAEIVIGRDPYESADPQDERWRARLALSLPSLGRVEVDLDLLANNLALRFAADDDGRARLNGAAAGLIARLAARGLQSQARFTAVTAAAHE